MLSLDLKYKYKEINFLIQFATHFLKNLNALFKTHIELMRYDDVIIDCDIRVVMLATYLIKYKMLVRSKFMRIRSNFS